MKIFISFCEKCGSIFKTKNKKLLSIIKYFHSMNCDQNKNITSQF